MSEQNKTLVSAEKSWWLEYFEQDDENEQRKMLFPMTVTFAFGLGICDNDGWFVGCAERRDKILALIETRLSDTVADADGLRVVFTEWDEHDRAELFDRHGLTAELDELCALFAEVDECKAVVDQILASDLRGKPHDPRPNPDWRINWASWNKDQRGAQVHEQR